MTTPQNGESLELRYARHTRNAVVIMAWIIGVLVVLSLIGTIVGLVEIHSVYSSIVNSGVNNNNNSGF